MWPFKKNPLVSDDLPLEFSQVDTTERFDDNLSLGADDWIATVPINTLVDDGERMGLPAIGATEDQIYSVANRMSRMRESFEVPGDGVYCPICHIANVDIERLRTACAKCGRQLLRFGWD